jgi:hypothetical protein
MVTAVPQLGVSSYQVVASPSNPDNWVLKGTGTRRTAIESFAASLTRDRLYPFVRYTTSALLISGAGTAIQGPVGSSGSMKWTGLTVG